MGLYSQHVVVIGGGIIGLLSARELIRAGHRVLVLDKSDIGTESSWAGGGILSPLYPWRYPDAVNDLAAWSQFRYQSLCQQLHESSGIDPEWRQSGLLILNGNEAGVEPWKSRYGSESVWVEGLDSIREIEPRLGAGPESALWMPHIAQVRNPRLLAAIRADIEANGCEFRQNTEVTGLKVESGQLLGIETVSGVIETQQAIIAAGAWTGDLLATCGVTLQVRPVRGQMILLKAEPDWLRRIVLQDQRYVIPRADGRILVGSTLEEVGYDKSTTAAARQELLAAATRLIPGLADFPVETQWAGLRPGSVDGTPTISRVFGMQGLVICSGHYRNGLVLGPASARLAVDLLLDREPILDYAPYYLE
ncbi:MAG: glycine oxidase ThiO [Proteobacteria bacterium]|nr:glycine oxidase ThiO [Pseudomonadota bacterium]